MSLRLYNTLSRTLEEFKPLNPPTVTMYVCGPTVYDIPHIGHARSAYVFDVLRRHLESRAHNYKVTFVRNVTDVDDKIIERARQELGARGTGHGAGDTLKNKCKEVAERYLTVYRATLDQLGIEHPTKEPKATEHVLPDEQNVKLTGKIDASMTGFVSELFKHNMAYEKGGDVYFPVRKFNVHGDYGRLSNRSLDELQTGTRVESGEHKEDPLDFALWKAAKPDEPSWNSPWGPGRPGWHIECSVMSTAYLGDEFDIHGGGVDLVFPHHENELAQARAIGKKFARFWIHNGLLTVNGEKMSKSVGNFITVEDALKTVFGKPDVLKVFFLGSHYRSPIDYTQENALAANQRLNGWVSFLDWAENYRKGTDESNALPEEVHALQSEFVSSMDNDLNTPAALATLDGLMSVGREYESKLMLKMTQPGEQKDIRFRPSGERPVLESKIVAAADTLKKLGKEVFGLFSDIGQYRTENLPPKVKKLIDDREAARQHKDFKQADVLRKQIEDAGFLVADTSGGSVVRPKRT